MIPPIDQTDRALLARAAEMLGAGIETSDDPDLATALLYQRLRRSPADETPPDAPLQADLIGIVPGAFHREHRTTGADGRRILDIAATMGLEAHIIPVPDFGRLDDAAATLGDWLRKHRNRRIALFSLSKGGAEVKRALESPDADETFAPVSTWINFSGIVQGTPLIDWLHARPLRWWGVRFLLRWRRHNPRALDDLAPPGNPWPQLPGHLRVVHVYGFPTKRHLSHPWAHRAYDRLAPLGANDGGGNLLAPLLFFPGTHRPIWGADHYLDPPWDILPLLTGTVRNALAEAPRQPNRSPIHPSTPPASRSSA